MNNPPPTFKRALSFLSSLRLAIIIISLIVVMAVPATLVVQNQPEAFYRQQYPGNLGLLIIGLGYDHFFRSTGFLIILGLFWLNLLLCTVKRLSRQLRKTKGRRFGPDILHVGLILLLLFGIWSGFSRREGILYLERNDAIQLPSDRHLILDDFRMETYDDGRPKLYTSMVRILDENGKASEPISIEVNKPLRIDGLTIYQYSYLPDNESGLYNPGLMLVQDKFKPFVLTSLCVIIAGVVVTLVQRKGE